MPRTRRRRLKRLRKNGSPLLIVPVSKWPNVRTVSDRETALELYGQGFGLPSRNDPPAPMAVIQIRRLPKSARRFEMRQARKLRKAVGS